MSYRKRVYIEEIPRISIGKDYRAVEDLIANKGGIKMTINEAKKKSVFFFRYYKEFPIPEDGVVICSIPCNYGGLRYFYVCPYCTQRYRHLYLTPGKNHPRLLCRKCCFLSYRTQSENEYNRLIAKFVKLLHKYGFKDQHIKSKDIPKGIHKKTFQKIKKRIQQVGNKVIDLRFREDLIQSDILPKSRKLQKQQIKLFQNPY
ncbi:MAG: hypothetical protein ACRCSV_01160 [Chlamydiales bacterium]